MYMYVYVCIYIYVWVYVYIFVYMHAYVHIVLTIDITIYLLAPYPYNINYILYFNQTCYEEKKKKSILELRKNLSKGAYTTTIYLSGMIFIKTTQNFLRNSGKSR